MSKRKSAYYRYLESREWRQLRQQAFKRDGYKCTHCGSSKNLRCHHLRYRKNLLLCTVDDLITLCNECHEAWHRKHDRNRKRNRKPRLVIRHLAYLILNYSVVPRSWNLKFMYLKHLAKYMCPICGEHFGKEGKNLIVCIQCDHHWFKTTNECHNCHKKMKQVGMPLIRMSNEEWNDSEVRLCKVCIVSSKDSYSG